MHLLLEFTNLNKKDKVYIIDPKAVEEADYLVDYYKLFSSFSGQGHLEYLGQNPESKAVHFCVNPDIAPNACTYVCSPQLKKMKKCQDAILKHIVKYDKDEEKIRKRFLLLNVRLF